MHFCPCRWATVVPHTVVIVVSEVFESVMRSASLIILRSINVWRVDRYSAERPKGILWMHADQVRKIPTLLHLKTHFIYTGTENELTWTVGVMWHKPVLTYAITVFMDIGGFNEFGEYCALGCWKCRTEKWWNRDYMGWKIMDNGIYSSIHKITFEKYRSIIHRKHVQ